MSDDRSEWWKTVLAGLGFVIVMSYLVLACWMSTDPGEIDGPGTTSELSG